MHEIARSATDVERALALPNTSQVQQASFPDAMQSKTLQVINEIVSARDSDGSGFDRRPVPQAHTPMVAIHVTTDRHRWNSVIWSCAAGNGCAIWAGDESPQDGLVHESTVLQLEKPSEADACSKPNRHPGSPTSR